MACVCPEGALPASYADTSADLKGKEASLGGARAYVSGDPRWGTAVVFVHDVYGIDGGRQKALCDALAAGGHYVVMPDFYEGGSIEPYYKRGEGAQGKEWLKRFDWAWCSSILQRVYDHLKQVGVKRVGAVGFCWGAWVVAKACQDPSQVQAGVWFHPSCQVGRELYNGETEQELAARIRVPTLMCPSPQEAEMYKDGELVGILQANGVPGEAVYFGDQSHGWMTRAAGFLGRSWQESGGVDNLTSIVGVQRGVNLMLGWYAKYLHA